MPSSHCLLANYILPAGNSAQATTQPQLMQTARRDVLQQASNSSARPPLAPTGPSSTPAGLLKHAADSALVGPAAKRPKRDKDDIDEENDIFKVFAVLCPACSHIVAILPLFAPRLGGKVTINSSCGTLSSMIAKSP